MSKYQRSYFQESSARKHPHAVRAHASRMQQPSVVASSRGFLASLKGIAPRVMAVAAVLVMGVMYLGTIGATSQHGFQILGYEEQITELRKEHQRLELRSRELESLSRIEREANAFGLVHSANIVYLPDTDSNVAVAD